MLVIDDVLVSEDIIEECFCCDLHACKGACCTEGDYGAPLEKAEMGEITKYLEFIKPYLPERSVAYLENHPGYELYEEPKTWGTSCHEDGACVFLNKDANGIGYCAIEKAWADGKIPFKKPVSCHLYPIRISKNDISGFEAWNYDIWDICAAARIKGKRLKMPIYRFVKDAIIRKKGQDFYDQLEAAADHLNGEDQLAVTT